MADKIDCGKSVYFFGKDKERVERDAAEALCSLESQCQEGDKKRHCSKRSLVGPSKEDPKLYLGFVWCPCPKDLE